MRAVPLNRYLVFSSIAILGCAVDLATKSWIFNRFGIPGSQRWQVGGLVFGLETNLNQGALFGMGQGWVTVFALLSVGAAAGILFWLFYAGAAHDRLLCVALGCVMGGILGNLYDRLGLHGIVSGSGKPVRAVRDWILVMLRMGEKEYPWPTFNIADSLLVCGAVLLVWHAFNSKPEAHRAAPEDGDTKARGEQKSSRAEV